MTSPTHIAFSQFCLALFSVGSVTEYSTSTAVVAALGSLAPDIDNPDSWIGRVLPFISKPVERKFGHRTITHSLIAILIILTLLFTLFWQNFIFLPFSIGYISHIIIDCSTVSGVKILYPISLKSAVFPFDLYNPVAYRAKVGSIHDLAMGFIFAFLTIPFAYISVKTYKNTVREVQRDVVSAVRTYNELAKDYLCYAKLKGINTTTHEDVEGRFLIVAAKDKNTLVIRVDGNTLTVGQDNFKDDIATTDILTVPDTKAAMTIKNLEITNNSIMSVISVSGGLNSPDTLIYVTGELDLYESVSLKNSFPSKFLPVRESTDGKRFKLNLASLDLLKELGIADKVIKTGNVTLRILGISPDNFDKDIPSISHEPFTNFQSIEVKPSETIKFTVKTGYKVSAGDPVAYIQTNEITKLNLEIKKLEEKRNLLNHLSNLIIKKYSGDSSKINNQLKALKDQLELTKKEVNNGTRPSKAIENIVSKQIQLKELIEKFKSERDFQERKIENQIKSTNLKIEELQIKISDLRTRTTITATQKGTIKEIREINGPNIKEYLIVYLGEK